MSELLMNDVRKRLSQSKNLCKTLRPDLKVSEAIYSFAEYMSLVAPDQLAPFGMAMCMHHSLSDIQRGKSFSTYKDCPEALFKYLVSHYMEISLHLTDILQIVDTIAEKEYAKQFRVECQKVFGFSSPSEN